jgi:hypothetical protein
MKNYYYNPKTQDLTIFDTESKEMLVLERLLGIRVITSSELDDPTPGDERKAYSNFNYDPKTGKANNRGEHKKWVPKKTHIAKKRAGRVSTCKNCGEQGHFAKTCKNPPKQSPPPLPKELPDEEVTKIAREERQADSPA